MIVTRKNERPYEAVIETLRKRIESGAWQVGEMIPGRRRLATEFGVSLSTVERAVAALIAEGLLRADDRRGTFIADSSSASKEGGGATYPPLLPDQSKPLSATVGLLADVANYGTAEANDGQWPAQILSACEHRLSAEPGISQRFINLSGAARDDMPLEDAATLLLEEAIDAVLILGEDRLSSLLPSLRHARCPVVCATYESTEMPVPNVFIDDVMGGVLAARHLRERGYDRLVFIRPYPVSWIDTRLRGAQAEVGVDAIEILPAEPGDGDLKQMEAPQIAGEEAFRALMPTGITSGTGIIAPNDAIALGWIQAAAGEGLEAGLDYGIVGFDDRERESQLTSLRPPLEQLGTEAARILIAALRGESSPSRTALPPSLIARASTRVVRRDQKR